MQNKISSIVKDRNIRIMFFLYFLSNILLILNINGIYWDDWILFNQDFALIQNIFQQATGKLYIIEYIHGFMGNIGNGVYSYRIATFIVYFLSGLFLYYILLDIKELNKKAAFYITLIFLLVPVNNARISLINFPSGLFLCIFFMAFYLLTKYINEQRTLVLRIFILILFFSSFVINSLLVFFSLILIYLAYKHYESIKCDNLRKFITSFLSRHIDFLFLPILFYYLKAKYFRPYGLYQDYNSLSLSYRSIKYASSIILKSFKTAFYEPLTQSFITSCKYALFFILLLVCMYLLTNKKRINKESFSNNIVYLVAGILCFALGVLPYALVGKIPLLTAFHSRHMLLLSLGISLALYSFILLFARINTKLAGFVFCAMLSSFILKNLYDQSQFLKDWFYQVALEEKFKENEMIRENSTFIFQSSNIFANSRIMEFYEHNGRLKKIFGNTTRLMVKNPNDINTNLKYRDFKQYNFSDWNNSKAVKVLVSLDTKQSMSNKLFFHLLLDMLINNAHFHQQVKQLIQLKTSWYDG